MKDEVGVVEWRRPSALTLPILRRETIGSEKVAGVRKVVDSNFLQSDGLRDYLTRSPKNLAIITDYAAMEAYKGDTLASIYRSMEILAEHPKQVVILKNTLVVCGLRGRRSGLQRRMVSEDQTKGFAAWCKNLAAAKRGNMALEKQLLDAGRDADAQMNRILADMKTFADTLEEISKSYTPAELQILRTDAPYTGALFEKINANILHLAAMFFVGHPKVVRLPPVDELPNTFIFRFALCGYLLALRWIRVGGAKKVKHEKLRNDMVDVNFAAYATYFDGLLTADAKATEIYRDANFLLKRFYLEPIR